MIQLPLQKGECLRAIELRNAARRGDARPGRRMRRRVTPRRQPSPLFQLTEIFGCFELKWI